MFSPFESFFGVLIVVAIIYFVWKGVQKRVTVSLALRQFIINPDAENQIVIEGRRTGLIQWLLVLFNFGNIYKIHVKKDYISYSSESIQGESLTLTPLQKIATTSCGYRNPIGYLIAAAVVFLIGLISIGISSSNSFSSNFSGSILFETIVATLVLVGVYFLNKRFYISIQTLGGREYDFSFGRNFIENVPIDIAKVKEAIERINELVLDAQ